MNNPTQNARWIPAMQGRTAGRVLVLALVIGLAVVAATPAQAQTFTSFDAPGAGTGALQGTAGVSINTGGTIAGVYIASGNVAHGFVRATDGTITTFDAPGAGTGNKEGTFPLSINTAGTIAGYYADGSNGYHGFVRTSKGAFTTIDVPGANGSGHLGTTVLSINTAGAVTGTYRDANLVHHGFIRSAQGAMTFPIDVSGAQGTDPGSINSAGDITGGYRDSSGVGHGFLRTAAGVITTFDAPGAGAGGNPVNGTTGFSINTADTVAGAFPDTSGVIHGFVRTKNGTITTFDAPGAGKAGWLARLAADGKGPSLLGTAALNINTAGVITGGYVDASAVAHGFVRATNGTITTFDAPGAGMGTLQGTGGFSINTAGVITGAYFDANGTSHGFVRSLPTATTTTLTSSPNPSTYGQAVTFTADVTSKLGAPPDGETVSFMSGTTVVGTGTLSAGSANFTTSTLKAGTSAITAVYGGDSKLAGSKSAAVSQVVGKATTTTALISSVNPSDVGQSVTFTASVIPESGGTVTGTVSFYDGAALLKTVAVSGGTAKYATTKLASGSHTITATYNGSSNYTGSSASLTQTVN